MLDYFKKNDFVDYIDEEVVDWKDAVVKSSASLLRKNIITEEYVDAIIENVENFGPYIVIAENIAMPHAPASSKGINGTAISYTKFASPVEFVTKEGEVLTAQLFFTLVAQNPDEHLQNITNLMELLTNEAIVDDLAKSQNIEDFNEIVEKYCS